MTQTPAPRRGARLGGWALALAVLGPMWLGVNGILMLLAFSGPEIVGWIATAMVFAGFVVVPGSGLVAVVLGIAALLANRTAGKVMGVIAIVLVLAAAATFVWALASGIAGGFSLV